MKTTIEVWHLPSFYCFLTFLLNPHTAHGKTKHVFRQPAELNGTFIMFRSTSSLSMLKASCYGDQVFLVTLRSLEKDKTTIDLIR